MIFPAPCVNPKPTDRLNFWGLGLASILLALGLYHRVLTLPLYHDDLVLIRLVATDISFRDIFFSPQIYQYYRPIYDAIWKVAFLIWGFHLSAPFHGLFMIIHGVNGWLAGIVAGYLYSDQPVAKWLAMATYVAFPFSYQAVPWASATGHLIVAGSIMLAVVGLEHWWNDSRRTALALIWFCTLIATFTHEAGIISGAIVGGWLFFGLLDGSFSKLKLNWRRVVAVLLPVAIINGLYVLAWVTIPKDKAAFGIFLQDLLTNLLFFSQGLTYPITQFGGLVMRVGFGPFVAAILCVAVGSVLLTGLYIIEGSRGILIGTGWFVISILPPVLFLPWWTYVIDGHRLAVTASVGVALAWAGGVDSLLRGSIRQRVIAVLITILLVGGGCWYVLRQMALHARMAPLYNEMYAESQTRNRISIFNLPGWISYRERIYPLGNDGINYVTEYFPLSLLIWANTGHEPQTDVFVWNDVVQEQPRYWFGLVEGADESPAHRIDALRNAPLALSARVIKDRWEWERGGPAPEVAFKDAAGFSNGVQLAAQASYLPRDRIVSLSLAWNVRGSMEEIAFVHLICAEQLIGQNDGPPLSGIFSFAEWSPDQRWKETRLLTVPAGTNPGCLEIRVGLYNAGNGQRIDLQDGGDFIVVPVVIREKSN